MPAIVAPSLALDFPDVVFTNPSFDALARVQPELLEAIGRKAFHLIREGKSCPSSYLAYAVGVADQSLLISIAEHPDTTVETLSTLATREDPAVQSKARERLGHIHLCHKESTEMPGNRPRNPINRPSYDALRERFGWCASWAIWSPEGATPKSGIADLSHFAEEQLATTLGLLHADAVFVGLNISRDPGRHNFSNFHSDNPAGQDYKLRHALAGTRYWGAYMTDVIKGFEEVSSAKLMAALRADPGLEAANAKTFVDEIELLGAIDPLLVALGADVHKILTRNFEGRFRIVRVPHYATYVAPQAYREQVLAALPTSLA